MKRAELNSIIYNYIKNDLPHGALVLAGPSKSGKSHYLFYDLAPYLAERERCISCVMVSLSGLKDISEVSKNLFLENRAKPFHKKQKYQPPVRSLRKPLSKIWQSITKWI